MTTPDDEIPDRYDSESRKVHYQAELAKLQTLKERGELVQVTDVKQEASRLARQVRDLLLMIPTRNAAKVVTMQDQEEVRALLQAEIESALRGLAGA
jgi:phage terminase Nu1 subunit (DNA packaging protein)